MGHLAFLPTLSTLCIVISAIFVAIGWYFIKQRKINLHQKMMITAAVFAVLFSLFMRAVPFLSVTPLLGDRNI